jgi:hypothetical protein
MPTEIQETTAITERAAKEEIRDVVRSLEALRFRLVGVRASLPAPTDEETDPAADLRTVIDCVLADSLGPAIRDLNKAMGERPGGGPGNGP